MIIGIYDGHNASASYINKGKLISSVEEEKFTRIKNHDLRNTKYGAPIRSIEYCLKASNWKCKNFSIALQDPSVLANRSVLLFIKSFKDNLFSSRKNFLKKKNHMIDCYNYVFRYQERRINKIKKVIHKFQPNSKIELIDHHYSHAASAYYSANFDNSLVFTFDGRGDALSGSVYLGNKCKLTKIKEYDFINSIGHFYSAITIACGFKAIKHEGKITGLAAHGKIKKKLLKSFRDLLHIDKDEIISHIYSNTSLGPYPHSLFSKCVQKIKKIVKGYNIRDISATAQYHTEEIVLKLIYHFCKKFKKKNVCLAGGIFANVLLNKKISEKKFINNLFIHPAMSDAGISYGASIASYYKKKKRKVKKGFNIFIGPKIKTNNIEDYLKSKKLTYQRFPNAEKEVAKLLFKKKIIARCVDSLEYGPRALGNRSILFHAADPSVNIWLNKKLNRSEFMPFAPIVIAEERKKFFKFRKNMEFNNRYMTLATKTKSLTKKKCPAIVHVDGTARPQILFKEDNAKLYKLMNYYFNLSGIPCLINTSFNIHDEPIVCNEFQAIDVFIRSNLDFLQLNNYIINK